MPLSDSPPDSPAARAIADAVARYGEHANVGTLIDAVRRAATDADRVDLEAIADRYRELPEVVIPIYESIVKREPANATALVKLANVYWLTGRGPEVVGALAQRAIDADASNRGAWHLWALAESNVRDRMERWRMVTHRFPADQLARAALADNATSLASAEQDPVALDLAIETYQGLLKESINPLQTQALVDTLEKLRSWRL